MSFAWKLRNWVDFGRRSMVVWAWRGSLGLEDVQGSIGEVAELRKACNLREERSSVVKLHAFFGLDQRQIGLGMTREASLAIGMVGASSSDN